MRDITIEAAKAFRSGKYFSRGNTKVTVEGSVVKMFLFKNLIAQRTPLAMTITNCGWFTPTTMERLNGLDNVDICQKKGKWYLNDKEWDGENTIIGAFGIWIDGRAA